MRDIIETTPGRAVCCLALALLLTTACSDDDTGKDIGVTRDATVGDGPAGEGAVLDKGADQKVATCSMGKAINACTGAATCKATRDCSAAGTDVAGSCSNKLCVTDATSEAKVEKDKKWDTAPDLSCLTTPPSLPTGPTEATVWGPVEAFGMGDDTTGVKVEVFDAVKDKDLKTPLTTATSAAAKDTGDCTPACAIDKTCLNKVCVKDKDGDGNPIGYVKLDKVPTNAMLVFRATKTGIATTVQYNLWIKADKVTSGMYKETVYVVSSVTKNLIAAAAGAQILLGTAAVAGEIHDCNNEMVKGAKVTLSLMPQKLAYFNGQDMPDQKQSETNTDSLYAAVNIKPPAAGADMRVAASAKVNGKVKTIADYTIKVFPDQITILTTTPWHPGKK